MDVAEMCMLKWMCGLTRMERIRGFPIAKLRENRLKWFRHVKRKTVDAPVRMVESLIVEGKRSQGRLVFYPTTLS